ncbi:MAG TPA: TusE/DsrC/DsvC family sulfur relay protein [Gallionella sp.]|nr:TusE/DsrC/DsvC family sulfur relay protein [Gallionella sp.]
MLDINKMIDDPATKQPEELARKLEMEQWSRAQGEAVAAEEGIVMGDAQWQVVDFLRDYYRQYGLAPAGRVLAGALDREFAAQGGTAYLLTLFPRGPVAQASRIGGLPVPPYTEDRSFGSAM